MSETVYLLGAGINRGITDWHGLKPPLAGDLFQQLLQSDKYSSEHYQEKIQSLLTYINDYWKLSNEDLLNQSFDIEACFTLIQMQKAEAELESKRECYLKLSKIEMQLTSLLAEFLNEFSHFTHNSDSFQELGRIIFKEKPTVITFNYDTLLEEAIESASGLQDVRPNSLTLDPTEEITEDELCYSHFNWNRPLAYGMKFDEVELHRAGVSQYVEGELFYSQEENKIYDWNLLKLHGSLNWFTYSGIQKHQLPGRQFESKKERLSFAMRVIGLMNFQI